MRNMLHFLAAFEPDVQPSADIQQVEDATPAQIVAAQHETHEWLKELGAPGDEIATEADRNAARKAFGALVGPQVGGAQIEALLSVNTPAAIQHLTGMLTAYDWEFVQQAKELRAYVVANLIKVNESPANKTQDKLKALQMLGKVTEVGLFTEKIEVKKTDVSDEELEQRIKERLAKAMSSADSALLDTTIDDAIPRLHPADDTGPDAQ